MRLSRPSPGTVLGGLALFVALSGTGLAATGTIINIADPTTASHIAHVDASGKLEVGDGSGPLTVDGTITARAAAPAAYFHTTTFSITSGRGCLVIASAPANKALIVREIRVDVFSDSTPGPDEDVTFYADSTCTTQVGDVNPGTVNQTVVPFDPGLGIPAGSGLSARASGSVGAEAYVDGYLVAPSAVPAAPAAPRSGTAQQR